MHEYYNGKAKDTVNTAAGYVTAASLQLRRLTGGAENTPLAQTLLHSGRAAEASELSPLVSKFPHHGSDGSAADSTRI